MTLTVHRATVTLDDGRKLVAEDFESELQAQEAAFKARDMWASGIYGSVEELNGAIWAYLKFDHSRPFGFNIMIEDVRGR